MEGLLGHLLHDRPVRVDHLAGQHLLLARRVGLAGVGLRLEGRGAGLALGGQHHGVFLVFHADDAQAPVRAALPVQALDPLGNE